VAKIIIFAVILAAATVGLVYVAGKITGSLFESSEKRIAQKRESPAEKPTSEKQSERPQPYKKPVTGESGKTEQAGGASESKSGQEFPPVDPNSPAAPYLEAFKLMVRPTDEQKSLMWKVIDEGWNEEYPELVKLLEANREALLKLKAAIARGDCYFPAPEDSTALEPTLQCLGPSSTMAQLLALETRFLEKEGDFEKAARNVADGIKFSQDVAGKGPIISDLIGLGIESIFIRMVKKEVCRESVNLNLCRALKDTFYQPERIQERTEEALNAEEAFGKREIAKLPSKSEEEMRLFSGVVSDAQSSIADYYIDSCIDSMTVEKFSNLCDQYLGELRGALQEGLFSALKKATELDKRAQEQAKSKEQAEMLLGLTTPAYQRCIQGIAYFAADYEMARTGLGLELYAAENGNYPESLSELVPRYLSSVPIDPFSGEVLKYAKSERGWRIYSFGPDMDDDNGEKEKHQGGHGWDYDMILRKK
jgi:hypothetical protein